MKSCWPISLTLLLFAACSRSPQPNAPLPHPSASPTAIALETPDAPFRAHRPPTGPDSEYAAPKIQEFTLSNGLRVLVLEQHHLPIVRVGVVVRGGWTDLSSEPVFVVKAVGSLLEKGTTTRKALDIASGYAALGAEHSARVDLESATANVKVLTSSLEPALDLLADIVQNPAFPADEVDLLKGRWTDAIAQQKLEVDTLARNATELALYGPQHPYGHAYIPTPAEVAAITPAALRHAYARAFAMQRASIVVVGDTTGESVLPKLEHFFGGWKRGPDVIVRAPGASTVQATSRIALIDRPGFAQSLVYLAEPGASCCSADRDAFELMNIILGGFWMSRLNANLRERLGYSYWASSSGDMRRGTGPFKAGGSMHTEKTGESIVELLKEVRKMTVEEPSAEELDGAKLFRIRWIVARFETTSRAAGEIDQIVTYDLPLDEPARLPARIRAVSGADVVRVARKYLHPDTMKIIVVGDRAKVEPQLAALGLGVVEVRDAYGNVVNRSSP